MKRGRRRSPTYWEHRPVVYRLYDRTGAPLYYGSTTNWSVRKRGHMYTKDWWPLVGDIKLTFHPNMEAATRVERFEINRDQPARNVEKYPSWTKLILLPQHEWNPQSARLFAQARVDKHAAAADRQSRAGQD